MVKLVKPTAGASEIQIGEHGRVYKADRAGQYSVDDRHHADLMRAAGAFPVSNQPRIRHYWFCEACDWEALINSCGKCGSTALERCER